VTVPDPISLFDNDPCLDILQINASTMGGQGRVKRQQVESDDGWTVITHGLSNLSVGKKKGKGRAKFAQPTGSMPTAIVDGLTAEKLVEDFNRRTERWNDTACASHLETVVAKRNWGVRNAMCIGIGSFCRDWEHRHRAMWQLVLFMSVNRYCKMTSSSSAVYILSAVVLTKGSAETESRREALRPRTSLHPA
jgi:hypothetical protein